MLSCDPYEELKTQLVKLEELLSPDQDQGEDAEEVLEGGGGAPQGDGTAG